MLGCGTIALTRDHEPGVRGESPSRNTKNTKFGIMPAKNYCSGNEILRQLQNPVTRDA